MMNFDYNEKKRALEDKDGYIRSELTYRGHAVSDMVEQALLKKIAAIPTTAAVNTDNILSSTGTLKTISAYNIVPANFFKARSALTKKLYGAAPGGVKILCIGDSITLGERATQGSLTAALGMGTWPKQLGDKLRATLGPADHTFGIPANAEGTWSTGRWSVINDSAGWHKSGFGNVGFAGALYRAVRNTTAQLVYTPGIECDTIRIYYPQVSGTVQQTYRVYLNDVEQANMNQGGAGSSIQYYELTGLTKSANHVLKIGPPITDSGSGSGDGYVVGVDCFVANKPQFQICNAGVSGSNTTGWNQTGGWSGHSMITKWAPDLTVIALTVNDIMQNVSLATAETNLTAIINTAQATGDVIICSPFPSQPGTNNNQNQAAFRDMIKTLATTKKCGFIDLLEYSGGWDAWNAKGYEYDAIGHLKDAGMEATAKAVSEAIRAALTGAPAV
jgi:lysophospholipase L1-like esterase